MSRTRSRTRAGLNFIDTIMTRHRNEYTVSQISGGVDNPSFVSQNDVQMREVAANGTKAPPDTFIAEGATPAQATERQQWSNGTEFLMSCIAMSVGLGNVWRFPFTVYENGGGAFLIPYIVVLLVIGKPLYYMEMALGQFGSLGSVQVWELAPVFKGIGYGQLASSAVVVTYYCSIMAITVYYLVASFSSELPWARCQPSWADCFDATSSPNTTPTNLTGSRHSSSELYFKNTVLREVSEREGILHGIGSPGWELSLSLAVTWVAIWAITCCGVKSSGKAAYFLALFPYVVLLMLLIRGVTLPGAGNGILFFIKPDFARLLDPTVWYAAVTQCFFSLGVGFGSIIMMSSYNSFNHNIYKDAMIVTTMDTATSLLAGCTIFGILGNLAYEAGLPVESVVQGGSGLAFVSYPEAIAKFQAAPQVFAFLFFLMLLTLGIGSAVALLGNIITLISDICPRCSTWLVSLGTCILGTLFGLVYVTPGGQYVLTLADYYSGTLPIYILVTAEVVVVSWVYGVDNLCMDLELMLGRRPGRYWCLTWGLVTPGLMIGILFYTFATAKPLTHNGIPYPTSAYAAGWAIAAFGLMQIPIWAVVFIVKNRHLPIGELWAAAVRPSALWRPGAADGATAKRWEDLRRQQLTHGRSRIRAIAAATLGRHQEG